MAAARKTKAKRAKPKAKKAAIKRPKRAQEAKAPLAEMDAAWQSLLETAIERHRSDAEAGPKKKPAKK